MARKNNTQAPAVKVSWKEIKRQKVLLIWAAVFVIYGIIF